jgi:myo-inositol-1(or 4)-monophosphatase
MCPNKQAIRETVMQSFPDHEFLGEEQVAPGIDAAIVALEEKLEIGGWLWIVDPIDGTTNFASGIPLNVPSIAAAYDGQVMVAVLFDPHRDELFTAVRGQGAHLNGQPIRVGSEQTLGDAVVGMESPAGQESLEQCLQAIVPLMPKCRTIRMLGSSAVMLPWVANGRLTAYWTPDECAWDIAAGALILQEAGGRVTDFEGNDFTLRTRNLVGSNGNVHDALLDVLVNEASLTALANKL